MRTSMYSFWHKSTNHLACLKTVVFLLPLAMTNREAFLHPSHLTVAITVCSDEQWHDPLHLKLLRCAPANIGSITPMRLRQSSYRAVIFPETTLATLYCHAPRVQPFVQFPPRGI